MQRHIFDAVGRVAATAIDLEVIRQQLFQRPVQSLQRYEDALENWREQLRDVVAMLQGVCPEREVRRDLELVVHVAESRDAVPSDVKQQVVRSLISFVADVTTDEINQAYLPQR